MRRRPVFDEGADTDALADEAGLRAMVDLLLGVTALLLVFLLAIGAQSLSHKASAQTAEPQTPDELDALFSQADGPVVFIDGAGVRLAGTDRILSVSEIAGSDRLTGLGADAAPLLVIAPQGLEAAFHLSARLAAWGVTDVRRIRLGDHCAKIDKVEFAATGVRVSCLRR
jgi:hypothetical protein